MGVSVIEFGRGDDGRLGVHVVPFCISGTKLDDVLRYNDGAEGGGVVRDDFGVESP